jgi:N utilization substance protein B
MNKSLSGRQARSVARLAAIQALYQMEASGAGVENVIREFSDHRFDRDLDSEIEGQRLAEADEAYFGEIVRGAVARQTEIDRAIAGHLAVGWKLERIDATLRALFRAAVFELLTGAPKEVVIDEYVEIAKSFFEGPEPGFVNAALDALARDLPASSAPAHERP